MKKPLSIEEEHVYLEISFFYLDTTAVLTATRARESEAARSYEFFYYF